MTARTDPAARAQWLRESARFLRLMLRALDAIEPATDPDARLVAQARRRDILEQIAMRFADRVPGALIRPGASPARLSALGVTVHCAAGVPQLYRVWATKADAVAADLELQIVMQRGAA